MRWELQIRTSITHSWTYWRDFATRQAAELEAHKKSADGYYTRVVKIR